MFRFLIFILLFSLEINSSCLDIFKKTYVGIVENVVSEVYSSLVKIDKKQSVKKILEKNKKIPVFKISKLIKKTEKDYLYRGIFLEAKNTAEASLKIADFFLIGLDLKDSGEYPISGIQASLIGTGHIGVENTLERAIFFSQHVEIAIEYVNSKHYPANGVHIIIVLDAKKYRNNNGMIKNHSYMYQRITENISGKYISAVYAYNLEKKSLLRFQNPFL